MPPVVCVVHHQGVVHCLLPLLPLGSFCSFAFYLELVLQTCLCWGARLLQYEWKDGGVCEWLSGDGGKKRKREKKEHHLVLCPDLLWR